MKIVLNHYEINKKTMVLIPVSNWEYSTLVLEADGKRLYVKETPFQLIKDACLKGGSTYEGRRAAVVKLTNIKNKVPIPINPYEQICAFPTHSPYQFNCHWIFFEHIASIHPKQPSQSIIIFQNFEELVVPISYYTLQKQMHRTADCIVRFPSYKHFPFFQFKK